MSKEGVASILNLMTILDAILEIRPFQRSDYDWLFMLLSTVCRCVVATSEIQTYFASYVLSIFLLISFSTR